MPKNTFQYIHSTDEGFDQYWDQGVSAFSGATVFYSSEFRQYDQLLFGDRLVHDDSFVVVSANKEVLAIVPLYAFEHEGKLAYDYGGGFLRAPLFCYAPYDTRFKKVNAAVFDHIDAMAAERKVGAYKSMIESMEIIEGRCLFNYLLPLGFRDEVAVGTSLIECMKEEKELWPAVRKSYQSLINKASRTFETICVSKDNYDEALCEEYRHLHFLAAGRQTRSIESFQAMYKMIQQDKAYLVLVREGVDRYVGAYYFLKNGPYYFYGSAATHPELDVSSGVGHLGLWTGIRHAQQTECSYFDLGQLFVQGEISAKEQNINLFKQGFGGRRVTIFRGTKVYVHD